MAPVSVKDPTLSMAVKCGIVPDKRSHQIIFFFFISSWNVGGGLTNKFLFFLRKYGLTFHANRLLMSNPIFQEKIKILLKSVAFAKRMLKVKLLILQFV